MDRWFSATSGPPPSPVNSAASVPETPGDPPAAKKQKTVRMTGRGEITQYFTAPQAATSATAARAPTPAAAAQAGTPATAAADVADEVMQRFESGRHAFQDLDLRIYNQAGAVSILDIGKAVDDHRWLVDGIPLRKGYHVRVKFTGARHALFGMVVEARVGAAVGEGRYDDAGASQQDAG